MKSTRTRLVIACAAGFLLAGCEDDAPTETATPAKPVTSTARAESRLPPQMVAAVSSTRNNQVVTVHFSLNGSPAVGKALPVDIAIVTHEPLAALNAHFEARDGLALATGNALDRQTDLRADSVLKHQLVILPGKEGVFMVTAIVETESGEGTLSRIFSIPVIVSAPAAAGAPATAAPADAKAPAPAPAAGSMPAPTSAPSG